MGTKTRIESYIKKWESKGYNEGIPDEAPSELERRIIAPSYRSICMALMRNPNNLESLGIKRIKCDIYQEIKREEINNRNVKNKQLKLNL